MISEAPAPPADKLAILVWAADPGRPELCATPFYFAAAAAAMDVEVEMYFTARSVELLRRGVAETLLTCCARRLASMLFYLGVFD